MTFVGNGTRKWIYAALALAGAGALVWAFAPTPLAVDVAEVQTGPLRVTVDEDGEARAHDRYAIAAPVAGRLMRPELHEGDEVAAGHVVAEIAPLPLSVRERDEQAARVTAAEALQREAQERVRRAQADYEQARRERERIERLVAEGFVSPQAAEQARVAEATRANELEAARYRAQSAAADVQVARAGLTAIDAARAPGAVLQLRAPVAGRVLRVLEKSERVIGVGTPILVIGDPSRYEIVLDVLSTEAVKVRPGMPVLIEGWGGALPIHARVRLVEPAAFTKVSALGVEEQRVNVIADFVDSPGPLGDGYRVEGRIVIWEKADALKLPTSSLFRTAAGWAVFTVEEGRARRRSVDIGQRNALEAQILGGLAAGAVVVRHPPNRLEDGARVRILPPAR